MNDIKPEMLDQAIVAHMSDALVFCDLEGTIRRWNAAAETLFGFSATEALGQNLDLIIPEKLRAAHWRGFQAAVDSKRLRLSGKPTVTRANHASGNPLYVEMSFALVLGADSGVIGSVAIARDVTERVLKARSSGA